MQVILTEEEYDKLKARIEELTVTLEYERRERELLLGDKERLKKSLASIFKLVDENPNDVVCNEVVRQRNLWPGIR